MTLTDRLESLFRSRGAGVWIDSWELLRAAGHCGWRSRLTDLRHRGFGPIENRQRRVKTQTGERFTVSEYRWTPESLLQIAECQEIKLHVGISATEAVLAPESPRDVMGPTTPECVA